MTDYNKLKVSDLKDLVKERDIPAAGLKLKQHYVDALIEYDQQATTNGENGNIDAQEGADNTEDVENGAMDTSAEGAEGEEDYAQDAENENRKRKRRSPTPQLDDESTSKKIKTVEEESVSNLPGEAENVEELAAVEEGARPEDRDVEMDTAAADSIPEAEKSAATNGHTREDLSAEPSRHAATRALYIRGFVRPLQAQTLSAHLESLASSAGENAESPILEFCHLDKMKTHAFASFASITAASRVRAALHNKVWPDEPQRKSLWVDYIPEDRAEEYANTEANSGDSKKWEVVYTGSGSNVEVALQEVTQSPPSGPRNPGPSGQGVPGAPSGPRERSPQQRESRDQRDQREQRAQESAYEPPQREYRDQPPVNDSFLSLDERFSRTEAKPKLYFKPVPEGLAAARLESLQQEISRDWEEIQHQEEIFAMSNMRRYTFEDALVVDSGPDFGIFGRPGGDKGGRGGGGRGGRGGGPPRGYGRGGGGPRGPPGRDRRGGRSGDFYAGSGSRW